MESNLTYRYLTYQELELFDEDFSEFLYTKRINRFEWRLLLDYSSNDALIILAKYSEQTFEKVMKTVYFLERRTISTLELISCANEEMISILLELPAKSHINFLKFDPIKEIGGINHFRSAQVSSNYHISREKDIFTLIESGYKVVNGRLYNQIESLRKTQLN
ncbi:DUF6495 family protein [Vicingaceae bacterium]|nr:DUF6495 family protein [Vicingaceae bacterium]